MFFLACKGSNTFEINASYRSQVEPDRQYTIYTTGTYPPGADMADSYQGKIGISQTGNVQEIKIQAENFTPRLIAVDLSADTTAGTGQTIDAVYLVQKILIIAPRANLTQIKAEAEELLSILEAAGMGPKIGMPATKALVQIQVSNKYL